MVDNKATGEKLARRTTYFEICTEDQAPKDPCNVHGAGGAVARTTVKPLPGEQWPRAALAVDITAVRPIVMKAPTVLGTDPYNSNRAITNAIAMKAFNGQNAPMESSSVVPAPAASTGEHVEVIRAVPVSGSERQSSAPDTTIKIDPPPPLQF